MDISQLTMPSRRQPPKSSAYVDPDETISATSDDGRTIVKDEKPLIAPAPAKKCAIMYIIDDDDDDDAAVSDIVVHYVKTARGSTAAKPILLDNNDVEDKVAAAPVPRVYHVRPRIKQEPVDDVPVVKIKKEFDPVADAKLSNALNGAQVNSFFPDKGKNMEENTLNGTSTIKRQEHRQRVY
ncbi:hypothetical protein Sste5344_008437 [Sporothrix stenoceras]